jgi:hypothetical protein
VRAMLLLNCVDQEDKNSFEQVWAWDGQAWRLVDDAGPPATVVAGVAFDPDRRTAVRYGGLPLDSNDCIAETWAWTEVGWTSLDADPPTACDHMFLAHDAGRDTTLLFGGGDADGNLVTETWGWDGEGWQQLSDEGPAGRAHFGFVYDADHQQSLIYGGYDGARVFEDLWAWDGSAWSELNVTGPGPRSHHGLAVGGGRLLLFGGASGPSTFATLTDETWELTEGRWRQLEADGPSQRGSAAIGYDPERDVFVLYGGFDATGAALRDTWEWSDGWSCVSGC